MVSDLVTRISEAARGDRVLAGKLLEIARLDEYLVPTGQLVDTKRYVARTQNREYQQAAQRVSHLCDEVASAVAQPGEDADEIGMWLSYNIKDVVRALPRRRWWWPFGK